MSVTFFHGNHSCHSTKVTEYLYRNAFITPTKTKTFQGHCLLASYFSLKIATDLPFRGP